MTKPFTLIYPAGFDIFIS